MFLKGVAKSKSGDISVSNIAQFDTELASISGDINTANTNGIIKSSTISGDISISSSEYSKIILKSVSGDIDLNCSFDLNEDAIINSVSGDISINFLKYSGDNNLILKTVSGDVDITGDKPADDRIKISQVKGDFSKFNPIGKEFFKGSFGNMFKNLKDHIKNVSENSATSEIRQTKEKDHNIQSILDMVAHGKITVDEAEKLIKALK
ncbi:MAG: DUF4097 family beta strand repeat protein, partial [Candidatus Delongbacteria bacterium]|nr:DUF4097 family beta strand repeat protein [Candidatus Delongbacteria bacterium]